nr:hypothetical protein [Flavipsychrobacter sp.]
MNNSVFAIATNITSNLGLNTAAHWQALLQEKTSIIEYEDPTLLKTSFWASKIDAAKWQIIHSRTQSNTLLSPFEQLALYSAQEALASLDEPLDLKETLLILSSTKGNIEWLGVKDKNRISLSTSAQLLATALNIPNAPLVI